MRIVYITCILLATTVCSIASDNVETPPDESKPVFYHMTEDATTAVPPVKPAIPANESAKSSTVPNTNTSTNGTGSTTIKPTDTPTTATTVSKTNSTTATTNATTTSQPTTLPSTKTPDKPTTISTVTPTPTASNVTTSTSSLGTTALPVSTKGVPPSPYKERHFDGLSFLGGIILAICLMAIAAFSWKFYRTLNEREYRTL
ncbi:G8 domain-containing protein DDB_G0286311-like [Hylaeus volcanicus]|uniref:G8 domain-containing protein DDB_G0286311-like n=1 Tax=Hylaeus volcanicus TaxID=313075 RepID=UPI0023B773B5|nr:G8 domain-containing protein DDB_G0286311-like [Hylaeus volcanicus]